MTPREKLFHLYPAPTANTILQIIIFTMMCTSIACLQTAIMPKEQEPTPATPPQTAMQDLEEPASGAVYEPETRNVTPKTRTCAIVTADQSLWIRAEPSEKSQAISWLPAGAIIEIKAREGDWWYVKSADATGFARAVYLQETECE